MEHRESIDAVRAYFDALGDKEWERLTTTVTGRVSLEVHRRFLRRFVRPGWRVLEVGAGPGRFTVELATIGARVVVTDISEVQLELNQARLHGSDAEQYVERRELLDVCDTARYADAEFDAVVAFGGPLSYAFARADNAMRGLLRLVRPHGAVVASVMSLAWRMAPFPARDRSPGSRAIRTVGPASSSTKWPPVYSPAPATAALTSSSPRSAATARTPSRGMTEPDRHRGADPSLQATRTG